MSMVLGLLPIVGSPLPIMSYGGSSMLATMIGFGIVMSAKSAQSTINCLSIICRLTYLKDKLYTFL